METRPDSLAKFTLRTFLWLPACFTAWYFGARYLVPVLGVPSGWLVDLIGPGLIAGIEREGPQLVFVTNVEVRPASGQVGVMTVDVNSLLYTYGLPLLVALMLAARAKPWKIIAGAALLFPFQVWGIAFDVLSQLGVKAGLQVSVQAGLSGWRAEFIALAYQLGSLIFPVMAPVALWVGMNEQSVARLVAPQQTP